ncbi:MAG: hypothetical protein ABIO02_04910, partial [Patescibacteria group bacterium]
MSKESLPPIKAELQAQLGIEKIHPVIGNGVSGRLDTQVLRNPQHLRPIIRGTTREIETSLSSLLHDNDVLRWLFQDKDQFLKAISRDKEIKNSLLAINELVQMVESLEGLSESSRNLLSLALTERTAELSLLSAPYMPKSVRNKIEQRKQEKVEESEDTQEFEDEDQKEPIFEKWKQWMSENMTRPQPRIPEASRPMLQLPKFLEAAADSRAHRLGGSDDSSSKKEGGDEKTSKRRREVIRSNPLYSNPLMDDERRVGRERAWKQMGGKQKMMHYEQDMFYYDDGGTFIITRIMNTYDPERGVMSADAPRERFLPNYSRNVESKITSPLGVVNTFNQEHIAVPRPVYDVNNERWKRYRGKVGLTSVELQDSEGKVLIDQNELHQFLEIDELGNIFVSLKELPDELKEKIHAKKVLLQANFGNDYSGRNNERKSFPGITASSPEDDFKLNLYPSEVAKLIEVLREKKVRGNWRFRDNTEIFARLAQFIGNYWLTYDLEDAPFDEDDPVGFQQTERVLARRQASCEGANIALGQLMRYFLGEGESIAYVEGFVLEKLKGDKKQAYATTQDFHLKVMYKDKYDRYHLFDATPWSPESHSAYVQSTDQYIQAKGEWIEHDQSVRAKTSQTLQTEHQHSQEATNIWQNLLQSWYRGIDPRSETLSKALESEDISLDDLPGYYKEKDLENLMQFSTAEYKSSHQKKRAWSLFQRFRNNEPPPFDISDSDSQDLITFLKRLQKVDTSLDSKWSTPRTVIDGATDFTLKHLERRLYDSSSTPVDVNRYIEGDSSKRALYADSKRRAVVYSDMAKVKEQAIYASEQNVAVIGTLTEIIHELSNDYTDRLKVILATAQEKMTGNVEQFWNGAPFMLLLRNPLYDLQRFFLRATKPGQEGFLEPSTFKDIGDKLESQIGYWQFQVESQLKMIDDRLQNVPLTTAR